MVCEHCGQNIPDSSAFCLQCGKPQGRPVQSSGSVPQAGQPPAAKSGCKPAIFLGCGSLLMLFLLIAGVVTFIFYKISDSDAAKLAVHSARESAEVRQSIGEVQKVGWPIGSISVEGGGSGQASFSMSVTGSRGKGKYFATLTRQNNQWRLNSARLQFDDGRSLEIPVSAVATTSPASPGPVTVAQGRPLLVDRSHATSWKSVDWTDPAIRLEVPTDWLQIQMEKRSLEFRPEDRSAYLSVNLAYFDQKIPFDTLIPALEQKAAAELKRGEIAGYARIDLGKAKGIVQIQGRGGAPTVAAWSGYYDTEEFGTVGINILLGAPSPAEYDRWEPVLGAILQSIQIR